MTTFQLHLPGFQILFALFMATGVKAQDIPKTVNQIDIERYAGRWYAIASYPARFQRDCKCTTAEYQIIPGKKYIQVINSCIRFKNGKSSIREVKGKAFPVEGTNNTQFKISFLWPFTGDYWIIGIAEDYSWAVVGHPKRKYLWILSRQSFLTPSTNTAIRKLIKEKGYDLAPLEETDQRCDGP